MTKTDSYNRAGVKESLTREANRELGICEQIRQVYDSVYELPEGKLKEEITEKLVDALIMAKKMGDRLTYYHKKYNDTTGHDGKNIKQLDKKALLEMRRNRIVK